MNVKAKIGPKEFQHVKLIRFTVSELLVENIPQDNSSIKQIRTGAGLAESRSAEVPKRY